MQTLSLVWGILAIFGMVVAFEPCLGSLNWLNIPFSVTGLVVSLIAHSKAPPQKKGVALAGMVLCAVAAVLGLAQVGALPLPYPLPPR